MNAARTGGRTFIADRQILAPVRQRRVGQMLVVVLHLSERQLPAAGLLRLLHEHGAGEHDIVQAASFEHGDQRQDTDQVSFVEHQLDQLGDAAIRVCDLDPAQVRIRGGDHVFLAHQRQVALRAIEGLLADGGELPVQAHLDQALFCRPGRHHKTAQAFASWTVKSSGPCLKTRSRS